MTRRAAEAIESLHRGLARELEALGEERKREDYAARLAMEAGVTKVTPGWCGRVRATGAWGGCCGGSSASAGTRLSGSEAGKPRRAFRMRKGGAKPSRQPSGSRGRLPRAADDASFLHELPRAT